MIFAPAKQVQNRFCTCQWLSLLSESLWPSLSAFSSLFGNLELVPSETGRLSRTTQISGETSALKCPCCPLHHDPQSSMQVLENNKQARSMVGSHILNLWNALFLNSSKLEGLPVTFSNCQRLGFPTCNQTSFLFSKHFLLYISLLCCICLSIYSFRPAGGFWLIKKPPVSTCHF